MISGINNGITSSNAVQQQNATQQKGGDTKANKTESVSRVEAIKQQIEAGTYKVDVNKTAEAMAETLI